MKNINFGKNINLCNISMDFFENTSVFVNMTSKILLSSLSTNIFWAFFYLQKVGCNSADFGHKKHRLFSKWLILSMAICCLSQILKLLLKRGRFLLWKIPFLKLWVKKHPMHSAWGQNQLNYNQHSGCSDDTQKTLV